MSTRPTSPDEPESAPNKNSGLAPRFAIIVDTVPELDPELQKRLDACNEALLALANLRGLSTDRPFGFDQ